MTKQQSSSLKGYTFIELIIVVSIIGILMTLGINAYMAASNRQAMVRNSRIVESILREAQKSATAGSYPCAGVLRGYEVRFQDVGGVSWIRNVAVCSGGESTVRQEFLEGANFDYTPGNTPTTITFRTLSNGVLFDPSGTSATIRIRSNTTGDNYTLTVNQTGMIFNNGRI